MKRDMQHVSRLMVRIEKKCEHMLLKKPLNNHKNAFLLLVKAGLWADIESVDLQNHGFTDSVDWEKVYQFAEEQSVVGLVLAGIEWFKVHDSRFTVPQELLLQWIGEVQMIEQQNKAMNDFVAKLIEKLRKEDVYAILVKGQGIAQCYERPLWRASGDVDLLLNGSNYDKAKEWLLTSGKVELEENYYKKRIEFAVDDWDVELHGTMRGELGRKIDKVIDEVQKDIFCGGNVRSHVFGHTSVCMPAPNNDVIFIFTHILQHFFGGGIGLRQICDWCRLMWTYKETLNHELLESRIRKAGLMSEWHAFAALAVDRLGMPIEAMPFYSPSSVWRWKAERIMDYVLKVGNFGHNKDYSYLSKHTFVVRKMMSFCRHIKGSFPLLWIFPVDTVKTSFSYFVRGTVQVCQDAMLKFKQISVK